MKYHPYFLLACSLMAFLTTAQETPYVRYRVKEDISLVDFANRYRIALIDIVKTNPKITDTIKSGTWVQIPLNQIKKPPKNPRKPIIEIATTHLIKPKETWYGISKKYGIDIPLLKKANDSLAIIGLKIGAILKIPVKPIKAAPKKSVDTRLKTHLVKPKETWYGISKQYGIDIARLKKANESSAIVGLKIGAILKIPLQDSAQETEQLLKNLPIEVPHDTVPENNEVVLDTLDFLPYGLGRTHDSLWVDLTDWNQIQTTTPDTIVSKKINIDFLMPFKRCASDTLPAFDLFRNKDGLPSIVVDFYLGASFALDSLARQGVKIRQRAFDTGNHHDSIAQIFQNQDFKDTDLLVGPIYSNHLKQVLDNTKGSIPVVYPVYSRRQIGFMGDHLVKTVPDITYYQNRLKKYISDNLKGRKLILIGDDSHYSKKGNQELFAYFKKQDSAANIHLINTEEDYLPKAQFTTIVADSLYNRSQWILLNTESPVITADVLNSIRAIKHHTDNIRLFGFRKTKNFDKVDNKLLAQFSFTYVTNKLYNAHPKERAFRSAYKKHYDAYPSDYAIRGFDVVYDTAIRLLSKNKELSKNWFTSLWEDPPKINKNKIISNGRVTRRVLHYFRYHRGMLKTIDNTQVYLVRYHPDLKLQVFNEDDY